MDSSPDLNLTSSATSPPDESLRGPVRPRIPLFLRIIPFFMSAVFFLSAVFAVFAPLPLILYSMRAGLWGGLLAILSNVLVVGLLGGWFSALVFLILVGCVAFFLPHFLVQRRMAADRAVGITLSLVIAFGLILVFLFWKLGSFSPFNEVKGQIADFFTQLQGLYQHIGQEATKDLPFEEFRRAVLVEMPSAITIFALIMTWVNLMMFLNLNPQGIRQFLGIEDGYFKNWRAPQFLVWPTIAAAAVLIWGHGIATDIAMNFFKVLMAVYAIQGLSILSFLLDQWKIRGFFRSLILLLILFFLLPLLLSLGFFDLWFDFRAKVRQV